MRATHVNRWVEKRGLLRITLVDLKGPTMRQRQSRQEKIAMTLVTYCKEREAQAQRRPGGSSLDRLRDIRGPDPAGSES